MSSVLHQMAANGKCIMVSSHILYEVEQMTKNILLMNRGRLLAQGDIYQIRSLIDKHPHHISIEAPRTRELATHLLAMPYVLSVRMDDARARVEIETREPDKFYALFPDLVLAKEFTIDAFESPDNNL